MPLEPPLAGSMKLIDFAASTALLKASTVEISGWFARVFTITPTPTRARLVRLPEITLPLPMSWSTVSGVITTTSKLSPASIRFIKPPTVSFSTETLLPLIFSYSGISATTVDLNAPAVSSLSSAAPAAVVQRAAPTAPASSKALNRILLVLLRRQGLLAELCEESEGRVVEEADPSTLAHQGPRQPHRYARKNANKHDG